MEIPWTEIHQEAIGHLQNLIRFDTTNPPGNESIAIDYIASLLKKDGIDYQVVEKESGRSNLVARLSSGTTEGPLLLSSHVDVVPAEADKWKHPPFGGKIEDGFLWGRGAVDMKHMAAYCLMSVLTIKRLGIKLKRDLIWAAVADEETGGKLGSRFLVEEHPDLVRAEYGINEMGGFTIHTGKKRIYPIQVAEKGVVWFRIRAWGEPGHGSLPYGKSAVVELARVIDRLGKKLLPRHDLPIARDFARTLAKGLNFPASLILKMVAEPWGDFLLKRIPDEEARRFLIATFHNTVCPTVLEGGKKINVIPSEASVSLDGRLLPGISPDSFIKEVRDLVGPEYEIEILKKAEATEVSSDTPLFQILKEVLEERDPGSEAVPYLVAGFTDASHYKRLGIKTYGFSPIRFSPSIKFSKLCHAHDERIPIDGFYWGVETFFEAVRRWAS